MTNGFAFGTRSVIWVSRVFRRDLPTPPFAGAAPFRVLPVRQQGRATTYGSAAFRHESRMADSACLRIVAGPSRARSRPSAAPGTGIPCSAPYSSRVVVSDPETHELGQVGHGAVEELEVTQSEISGHPPRAILQAAFDPIKER